MSSVDQRYNQADHYARRMEDALDRNRSMLVSEERRLQTQTARADNLAAGVQEKEVDRLKAVARMVAMENLAVVLDRSAAPLSTEEIEAFLSVSEFVALKEADRRDGIRGMRSRANPKFFSWFREVRLPWIRSKFNLSEDEVLCKKQFAGALSAIWNPS